MIYFYSIKFHELLIFYSAIKEKHTKLADFIIFDQFCDIIDLYSILDTCDINRLCFDF